MIIEPRFDHNKIRQAIMDLEKMGYIVVEKITPAYTLNGRYDSGSIYWRIGKPDNDYHVGIGYCHVNDKDTKRPHQDYYYHNGHSGGVLAHTYSEPVEEAGSTWNYCSKDKPGPGGWYTFDESYIVDVIDKLKK